MTALTTSMAVNTLVTGLIVFRILKVFLEVKRIKPTSVERSLGSTRGTKLRHAMFVVIESNMALFAMQLVCVVLASIPQSAVQFVPAFQATNDFTIVINQMLNVGSIPFLTFWFLLITHLHTPGRQGIAPTIILLRVLLSLSFDDKESFKEVIESLRFNNPPSDPDIPQRIGSSSTSLQDFERSEDDITPNDPNILRRVGSSSSTSSILLQETSGMQQQCAAVPGEEWRYPLIS